MAKTTLDKAKEEKYDEFYTQLADIENELKHYRHHFRDKTIFCNCDDPYESNFFKYFAMNFNFLGLKKLIATCFNGSPVAYTQLSIFDLDEDTPKENRIAYKVEITKVEDMNGDGAIDLNDVEAMLQIPGMVQRLEGNGDFRSKECIELLKEADIVVTNPPFSLFREYVAQLEKYSKKYIIIGNPNALTYKEIFPLIKENKLWIGYKSMGSDMLFDVSKEYAQKLIDTKKEGSGYKYINGVVKGRASAVWFTNLDIEKLHEDFIVYKTYKGHEEEYPKFDNYDAIEVSKVSDIPCDYNELMGVPITFMDKYNPEQFEIVGYAGGVGWDYENNIHTTKKYLDCLQHNPDGSTSNGSKINTGPALKVNNIKSERYYTASNCDGYLLRTYGRIIIRKKVQ